MHAADPEAAEADLQHGDTAGLGGAAAEGQGQAPPALPAPCSVLQGAQSVLGERHRVQTGCQSRRGACKRWSCCRRVGRRGGGAQPNRSLTGRRCAHRIMMHLHLLKGQPGRGKDTKPSELRARSKSHTTSAQPPPRRQVTGQPARRSGALFSAGHPTHPAQPCAPPPAPPASCQPPAEGGQPPAPCCTAPCPPPPLSLGPASAAPWPPPQASRSPPSSTWLWQTTGALAAPAGGGVAAGGGVGGGRQAPLCRASVPSLNLPPASRRELPQECHRHV